MTASMEIWPRRRQLLSSYGGGGGDLSPGAADAALVLTYVGASLSLLGSGTILTCFAALPSLRRFSFRLVAYLSMCDCLSSAMLLLGDPRGGSFACSLQSFVSQFSTVASVLWTAAIAFVLWKAVVNRSLEAASIPGLERRLHALVWGCSFVLMLLPLIDNSYGEAGTWCWIKNTTAGKALRLVVFYIPLWLTVGFNCVMYYYVGRTLRRTKQLLSMAGVKSDSSSVKAIQIVQRLGYYPVILMGVWIVPTINRIQNWIAPNSPVAALYIIAAITSSSGGVANAVAYGANRTVRKTVYDALPKMVKGHLARLGVVDGGKGDEDGGDSDSVVGSEDDEGERVEMSMIDGEKRSDRQ